MEIEAGKFYRTRGGRKVGPMVGADWGTNYPWVDENKRTYAVDGSYDAEVSEHPLDLIAEWTEAKPVKAGLPWVRVSVSGFDDENDERLFHVWQKDGLVVVWGAGGAGERIAFDAKNARALAAALTAYADQVENGE